jgi:hypothetical protein
MNVENSPPPRPGELDLGAMPREELKRVLVDVLTVKYPGIEQADIDRFLRALDTGNREQIEQTEADIAEKSALWQRAAEDLEGEAGLASGPAVEPAPGAVHPASSGG